MTDQRNYGQSSDVLFKKFYKQTSPEETFTAGTESWVLFEFKRLLRALSLRSKMVPLAWKELLRSPGLNLPTVGKDMC